MKNIKISTPGRICLFGEHQDYLGLPVIAAAISRTVSLEGSQSNDNQVVINLPDIQKSEQFTLLIPMVYDQKRDYYKSAFNVLAKQGFQFTKGIKASLTSTIPINAGTSSSSAILVAWIHLLTQLADNPQTLSRQKIAELAYEAEVVEFNEAGGMMDQYSTAVGNLIYLESDPVIKIDFLTPKFGTFVLGNSGDPKDTQGILAHTKFGMLAVIEKIKKINPGFSLHTTSDLAIVEYKDLLSKDQYNLLKGNVSDRDILREALTLLKAEHLDNERFGELLNLHQVNLREAKKISTPKIDRMITAALNAGALGAKINGSGGGGCMFAYAPNNPEAVKEAIESEGGEAFIITINEGTKMIDDLRF